MAKRKWPDHPGVGKNVTYNGVVVRVVDVKCGPMYFDRADLEKTDVDIKGTLQLRVKYPGGHEEWTPPLDGDSFVNWCKTKDEETTIAAPSGVGE